MVVDIRQWVELRLVVALPALSGSLFLSLYVVQLLNIIQPIFNIGIIS
jgi:hypothetical protein